jgi:hypothetical protein
MAAVEYPRTEDKDEQLLLMDQPIERVDNFKYLGSNMISSAYDLTARKGLAMQLFGT